MAAGLPRTSLEATAAAAEHRQLIGRSFYDCYYGMHRVLAEMYLTDECFTAPYERGLSLPGSRGTAATLVHARAEGR